MTQHSLAGYVMAGGASSRFGLDKARAEFGGQAMLLRVCDLLMDLAGSVAVVAAPHRYEDFGVAIVEDRWPGEGPLGGIITALLATAQAPGAREWNLIVGCDMPFLTRDALRYLVDRALASHADVVVPQSAHGLEPLCACWRTKTRAVLRDSFDAGVRKVTQAMKHCAMEVVDAGDWKRFDSDGRLFWNMNTPADYDEAKRVLEAERA